MTDLSTQTATFTKNESFGGLTTGIHRGKEYDSVTSIACGRDFITVILPKEVSDALAPHTATLTELKSFARFTGVSVYENQECGAPVLKSFTAKAFDIYDLSTVNPKDKCDGWIAGYVGRGGGHWQDAVDMSGTEHS